MVALSFLLSFIVNPVIFNGTKGSLIFLLALPLVLVHGIRRYGWKGMAFFVVVTYIISTFWESLSVHTGFPFGNYHYTTQHQILGVGTIIAPAYISLGYLSWQVANSILQEIDTRMNTKSSAILVSALAAIVMTVFDLSTDIGASTIAHSWIWEEGGAFFGVPFSNFTGWWFCTFTFYLVFSFYLKKNSSLIKQESSKTPLFQLILIYINLGMTVVIGNILKLTGTGTVADATGTVWNVTDIGESSLLWAVFGMFVLAFIAIVNLYRIGLPKEDGSSNY